MTVLKKNHIVKKSHNVILKKNKDVLKKSREVNFKKNHEVNFKKNHDVTVQNWVTIYMTERTFCFPIDFWRRFDIDARDILQPFY